MITFYELTNSDAVRAVLGVDEEEMSDEAMLAAGLENELILDIDGWMPEGQSVETIVSEGVSAERGTLEKNKYLRLSAYAKAFCAEYQLTSVENWRLIRLTDGNVDERRSLKIDIEAMRKGFDGLKARHKEGFLGIIEDPDASPVYFTPMGKSEPDFDPVTGS